MTTFQHANGQHAALLSEAMRAHRDLTPADAAHAHAATLRSEGRDDEAAVLESYTHPRDRPGDEERIAALEAEVKERKAEVRTIRARTAKLKGKLSLLRLQISAKESSRRTKERRLRAELEALAVEHAAETGDGLTPQQRKVYRQIPTLRKKYGLK